MPYAATRRANLRAVRRELPPVRKPPSGRLKLLVAVAAGAALLWGAVFVYRSSAVAPETVALTRGSVENIQAVDGLVVRTELVYTAPVAGTVRRLAAEGQRVRVGAPVAEITKGPVVIAGTTGTTPTSPPAQTTPPPTAATQAAPQGDAGIRRELDKLNAAIYEKAFALNKAKANGDVEAADRIQEELDQLAIRQSELTPQLGRSQPVVVAPPPALPPAEATVPAQQPPQTPPPPAALGQITATASGIVIYQTDGLEGQLAIDKVDQWTPAAISALSGEPRATTETVAKGDPVFKIVDNLSATLLAVVPEGILSQMGAADVVTIRFDGREGPPIAVRIIKQVRQNGEVLLVMNAPVFPEDLVHQRRFRATIIMGRHEGIMIPRTALDVRDGLQGVWVVEGAGTRFHPVRVLGGTDEQLALETDLKLGIRILKQAPTGMR
jgi:putative membrane fusion protein